MKKQGSCQVDVVGEESYGRTKVSVGRLYGCPVSCSCRNYADRLAPWSFVDCRDCLHRSLGRHGLGVARFDEEVETKRLIRTYRKDVPAISTEYYVSRKDRLHYRPHNIPTVYVVSSLCVFGSTYLRRYVRTPGLPHLELCHCSRHNARGLRQQRRQLLVGRVSVVQPTASSHTADFSYGGRQHYPGQRASSAAAD